MSLVAVASLVIAGGAGAEDTKLRGVVGPGFTIMLFDAQGNAVTRIPAGPAVIEIDDRSDAHNFHLKGPDVDESTTIEGVGTTTFRVTFGNQQYTFLCDPHADSMLGTFLAGDAQPPPPPPPPPPTPVTSKPSAPVGATLQLTSGPGFTITLRTAAGGAVKLLRPGGYTVVARDRSKLHNARLRGAGAARATTVPAVGTQTWRVTLKRGTLTFVCDPHQATMRGNVRVG